MLQQTTVAAAIPFYNRFIARFPDAQTLAEAPLDDVLAAWAGLGYYARARYLHALAKEVVRRGEFPHDLKDIESLPGVGRYTAGAVASIAFDIAAPIVDANVARVFSRVFLVEKDLKKREQSARLWREAQSVVEAGAQQNIAPSQLNPAIMELGALVCVPKNPRCDVCPVEKFCGARRENRQDELPFIAPKTAPTEMNDVCIFLITTSTVEFDRTPLWLRQRSHDEKVWWRGMWELPRTTLRPDETDFDAVARLCAELEIDDFRIGEKLQTIKHGVTIYRITLNCYAVETAQSPRGAQAFSVEETARLAMPSTMRRLVQFLATRDSASQQKSLFD